MTRIIAGTARGRRLVVPDGRTTRPTADRAREGLFGAVESALGGFDGVRVLDLYAGSGAVGLEALSRGAAAALLVESDAAAARVIRTNLGSLGLGGRLSTDRVERLAGVPCAEEPYDLVFADPPYAVAAKVLAGVLEALDANGWIAADALVVVERAARDAAWEWPAAFEGTRSRVYGEAAFWYGRRRADCAARPGAIEGPDGMIAP